MQSPLELIPFLNCNDNILECLVDPLADKGFMYDGIKNGDINFHKWRTKNSTYNAYNINTKSIVEIKNVSIVNYEIQKKTNSITLLTYNYDLYKNLMADLAKHNFQEESPIKLEKGYSYLYKSLNYSNLEVEVILSWQKLKDENLVTFYFFRIKKFK